MSCWLETRYLVWCPKSWKCSYHQYIWIRTFFLSPIYTPVYNFKCRVIKQVIIVSRIFFLAIFITENSKNVLFNWSDKLNWSSTKKLVINGISIKFLRLSFFNHVVCIWYFHFRKSNNNNNEQLPLFVNYINFNHGKYEIYIWFWKQW